MHRRGDEVIVATRSLEDITARLPEVVVGGARRCPSSTFVLDGEVLALDDQGRPRPFQETASRTAMSEGVHLTPYFFDLLHLDGRDLVDSPGSERLAALDRARARGAPGRRGWSPPTSPRPRPSSPGVLDLGHEGVVVKNLAAPYDAGRRGSAWVKVKPVHTLDLVVLAVEWGSGRRRGWLSNIHLGARRLADGFVMLGKTFKGMTDEMLAWQTERFTELAVDPPTVRDHHVVHVRPEQVVEIAFDGLQRSTRYPGGLALRFARVVRYRDDKTADRGRHDRDGARDLRAVTVLASPRAERSSAVTACATRSCTRSYDSGHDHSRARARADGRRAAAARAGRARRRSSRPPGRSSTTRACARRRSRTSPHAVGINRAIVYRHFTGKEELFALTLVGYLDELREARSRPPTTPTGAAGAGSRRWSGAFVDYGLAHPAFIDCAQALMRRSGAELLDEISESALFRLGRGISGCLPSSPARSRPASTPATSRSTTRPCSPTRSTPAASAPSSSPGSASWSPSPAPGVPTVGEISPDQVRALPRRLRSGPRRPVIRCPGRARPAG